MRGREGGRKGGRKGGREGGREGGRKEEATNSHLPTLTNLQLSYYYLENLLMILWQ